MTHNHHSGAIGIFALVAAIVFVFGPRVARVVVGSVLIVGVLFFSYVMFRVVTGTI